MKYTYLETMMFTKFFELAYVVGENHPSIRPLFYKLASLYAVGEERAEELLHLGSKEEIASVKRYDDYLVATRSLDYQERFGTPVRLEDEVLFALNCKGQGLRAVKEFAEDCGKYPTAAKIRSCLLGQKLSNDINIAFLAAFLSYEGVLLPKDKNKAELYAEKCVRWNNVDGILLLLHYARGEKKEYLSRLFTIADRMDMQEEFSEIYSAYGYEGDKMNRDVLMIAEYLDRNAEAAGTFDPIVSKVATTGFISLGDRKKLLESGDRSLIGQVSDLALPTGEDSPVGIHLRERVSEERKIEANQIEVCLRKQRTERVKVPILVSRDNIALRLYAEKIGKYFDNDTVYIDGSTCTAGCFQPTKGNLIIKNLIAIGKSRATFIFGGVSEIGEADVEQLSMMLSPINRGAYLLQDYNVMLDLSGCVFVLLADSEDIPESLAKICQKIEIAPATKQEAEGYVSSVIGENKALYECPELCFRSEAIKYLAAYDVTHISTVIGTICRQHSYETDETVVEKDEVVKASGFVSRQIVFNIGN